MTLHIVFGAMVLIGWWLATDDDDPLRAGRCGVKGQDELGDIDYGDAEFWRRRDRKRDEWVSEIRRLWCDDCDRITRQHDQPDGAWRCQICGGTT